MANSSRGSAAADDDDPYLQELIRGSVPGPSSSSRGRVAPLTDDEIGWFDCGICTETKLALDRFRAGACAHEFCIACVVRYIEGRVADGAVPVPCPGTGCGDGGDALHPEACKKLLDIDVFDAWCIALCERAVGPGRARCPYRDCGELVVLEGGGGGGAAKVACPTCKRDFCLQCEEPWNDRHGADGDGDGQGCVLARLARGRNWTRCPSCRAMIDKTHGCNRMVCRCGTVFCYKCGMPSSGTACGCVPWTRGEDAYHAFTLLNLGSDHKPSVSIDER